MHPDDSIRLSEAYTSTADSIAEDACCGSGSCPSCGPVDNTCCTTDEACSASQPAAQGSTLSCGNPVTFARLQHGEFVLDLGSGAGADVFSAARLVGPAGKVIGVDFAPGMLGLAREREVQFREEQGLANTEFREGDIQDLPLFDNSVDVVISNCVMNLATDRHKAFREAYRVLKPGGRLVVSDLAVEDGAAKQALSDRDDFSAAYAAALDCQGYLAAISAAGFEDVQVLSMQKYRAGQAGGDPVTSGIQDVLAELAASLTVLAFKPA